MRHKQSKPAKYIPCPCQHSDIALGITRMPPRRYAALYHVDDDGVARPVSPIPVNRAGQVCPCAYHRWARARCISGDELFPETRSITADLEAAAAELRVLRPVKKPRVDNYYYNLLTSKSTRM